MARVQFAVPTIHFLPASSANYTVANRPSSSIRLIVIHVTESSAASAETWFRNPKAQSSANYVVGQDGSITQMVRDSDIAWHAGNWTINRESIGIEHGGYTYRKGSFTDSEYRASARLVASEMRHYVLPIDRSHIIGHSQVPDPNHAGLFGGFAHHTDPGPYWNWNLYLGYVKTYARGGAPAPKVVNAPAAPAKKAQPSITANVASGNKVTVSSAGLKDGATVNGFVGWSAKVTAGDVERIEYLVDGRVVATGKSYNWDTTKETNGAHVLTVRVVTKKGATAGQSMRVTVSNSPFTIASANLTNGETVARTVRWEAVPSGATADHVDFLLDGKLVNTEHDAPYLYNGDGSWDTTKADNGPHSLTLRAVSVDGRVAESTVGVIVQNATTPPRKPTGISISMNGLSAGAVVSGKISWTATTTGSPKRVEFWVDGRWRWSENSAPWVFGGDGNTWDTTKERTGRHQVTVKAIAADGSLADFQTWTITIQSPLTQDSAPGATTMAVTSSVADGATVHGGVAWTATVNGVTPDRVDFFIDGKLRHTEHAAPYEFGTWDTTAETNGAHVLLVRATAPDGTTADTTQTVQVWNVAATTALGTMSVADGSTVSGSVAWSATYTGPRPSRIEFWVDGKLRSSATRWPWSWTWDTTLETNGSHTLVAKAISGTTFDQKTVTVTVNNAAQRVAIASDSLSGGQTVHGTVPWTITTTGATPDKVELSIDNVVVATGPSYAWDTTKVPDGAHTLLVKAYAGAQVDQQTFSVTVRNTVSVASTTIANGATVSGTKTWTVTTQGPTPDKVELSIDGALVATGLTYSWDTTKTSEGTHALLVKITAGAQAVSTSYTVTVANTPTVTSSTISNGTTVSGTKTWTVTTSTADKVELYVDGTLAVTGASYTWDTTKASEGSHTLLVKAYRASLVGTKTYTVTVSNTPSVKSSTISSGQTLWGAATWSVTTSTADKVELYVDGSLAATGTTYSWDTTKASEGSHTLLVKAYLGSLVGTKTYAVTVANTPKVASSTLTGGTVGGTQTWTVTTSGHAADRVELYVDGALRATGTSYSWDTTKDSDGTHTLLVKAYSGSLVGTATYTVAVRNASLAITSQSVADGSTISGSVTWTVASNGDKVEFWVDGTLKRIDSSAPFTYTLDTTAYANGSHTLVARAWIGTQAVTATATVTIANASTLAVTQNLTSGQVLRGTISWLATPTGSVSKLEFLINSASAGTFTAAPWGGSLNTTLLANGTYTFTVRLTGTNGSVVTASASVTVQN